jgi:FKBP-type peptidyl-prolyl cis-trans isomerase FklB
MKKTLLFVFCLSLGAPLFADGTNQLADEKSRASYAFGLLNGTQWKSQEVGFDPELFMRGLKDGLAGTGALMTEAEAKQAMQTFQVEFRQRQLDKVKNQGVAFLATNKLAPGVKILSVTLPDGKSAELQYQVLTNGTGPLPQATDRVSVKYRGTLVNGTEFDSSHDKAVPFGVGGVIKGWGEALQHMPVGSTWMLYVPSELGYGERGAPRIPPSSVLIFQVELLGIEPPVAPSATPVPAAPLTSDIIKVPSAEDLKKGAQIETIKAGDLQKAQAAQQQTNK